MISMLQLNIIYLRLRGGGGGGGVVLHILVEFIIAFNLLLLSKTSPPL